MSECSVHPLDCSGHRITSGAQKRMHGLSLTGEEFEEIEKAKNRLSHAPRDSLSVQALIRGTVSRLS